MALVKSFVFIVALSLLIVAPITAYDYFFLVLQWPNAYCRLHMCTKPVYQNFSIHGLWPQNFIGPPPSFCPGNLLKRADIRSIQTDLDVVWRNLEQANNFGFWEYQWRKHGICSSSAFSPLAYFTLARDIKNRFDILTMLRLKGIRPNGAVYSAVQIRDAIVLGTGFVPQIDCYINVSPQSDELFEIYFRLDKNGGLMNCKFRTNRCRQRIVFSSVKNVMIVAETKQPLSTNSTGSAPGLMG